MNIGMMIMNESEKSYRRPEFIIGIVSGIISVAIFIYMHSIKEQDVFPLFVVGITFSITITFFCLASFFDNHRD